MIDARHPDIETLYRCARETNELLPRVRALIPETATTPPSSTGGQRGRRSAAPTPWNDTFALLAYSIADDARRHEAALTLRLSFTAKFRAGTDDITHEVIGRLPVLLDHAREKLPDDDGVEDIARDLTRWPRECRRVLDELREDEQPWTTAPGDLRCPFCDGRLELAPGWSHSPETADVICRSCHDEQGRWRRWAPSIWTGLVVTEAEQYMSVEEAAHMLGISPNAVAARAYRGEWRRVGNGRNTRYDATDVRASKGTDAIA